MVYGRTGGPDSTGAGLFASDPVNGEGATVGLALIDRGNARVMLDGVEGREPSPWLDGTDE
jgi:hypothetical protein